jgi:hypothetical protein
VIVGAKAQGKYFTLGLTPNLTLVRLEGVLHPRVKLYSIVKWRFDLQIAIRRTIG